MNPFENQKSIDGVKNVIVIGSGKGGVGKSTVTANIAVALQKKGFKVGVLDSDLYGPSVPRIFGALNQKLEVDKDNKIFPIQRYGLKLMSMGFLVNDSDAVIWRGPMLFKAIEQFFRDVKWGELDYLLIDLPPGTGDIILTIAQKIPVNAAITVCTPQNLALIDAKKAIDMFEKVNIPLMGVIENMASFIPPGSSEPISLFPKGQLDTFLKTKNIEKLAEVPFNTNLGQAGEMGIPLAESEPDSLEAQCFMKLADRITQEVPAN